MNHDTIRKLSALCKRWEEFTARSLVGMTMGARKRRARTEADAAITDDRKERYKAEYGGWSKSAEYLGGYWELRAKYRIGQRLRPCPGCPACVTQMQDWSVDGAWVAGQAVRHREGCSHDDPTGYCCFGEIVAVPAKCDGSGVLPARKAVDTATCEGFDGPCNAADAELRSSRTMYHWDGTGENPNRPRMLCDECYRSYTAYWDEMWAQVDGWDVYGDQVSGSITIRENA